MPPKKKSDKSEQAVKEIRRLLPQLSEKEQRELRLLLDTYHTAPEDHRDADWLLSGIQFELKRRGLSCPPLSTRYVNQIAPNAFDQTATVRETLLASARGASLSTLHWLALGRLCARSLAGLIESWKVVDNTDTDSRYTDDSYTDDEIIAGEAAPKKWKTVRVSVQTMLRNIGKVLDGLDADFPGYVAAGMLPILVSVRPSNSDTAPDNSDERYARDERYLARRRRIRTQPPGRDPDVITEDEFNRLIAEQEENKRKGLEAAAAAEDEDVMSEDEFIRLFQEQEEIKRKGLEAAAALEEAAREAARNQPKRKLAPGDFDDEDSYREAVERQERKRTRARENGYAEDDW